MVGWMVLITVGCDHLIMLFGMSNIGCSTQTYGDKRILGTSQPIN